jgi:hypothetical protein
LDVIDFDKREGGYGVRLGADDLGKRATCCGNSSRRRTGATWGEVSAAVMDIPQTCLRREANRC